MTVAELATAVSRPFRFERALKGRRYTSRPPGRFERDDIGHKYLAAEMIPGGRWLAVISQVEGTGMNYLRILDISPPRNLGSTTIAECDVSASTLGTTLTIQPSSAGGIICATAVVGTDVGRDT